jgi:hypothetical protein
MVSRFAALVFCVGCASASGTVLERDARDTGNPSADAFVPLPNAPNDAAARSDAADSPLTEEKGLCRTSPGEGFVDQFDGDQLDAKRWLVAHGNVAIAGERGTGGFVRDNIAVRNGKLVLSVRGDAYAGDLRGIDATGRERATGARSGAAIASRDLFMSASYQWEGRLTAPDGVKLVLMALRDAPEDGLIAITAPGQDTQGNPSYAWATALVEGALAAKASQQILLPSTLADGMVHSLRFDWHAGPGATSLPSVDIWQDGEKLQTMAGNAPARAARAWLVAFVPDGSVADFDTIEVEISTAFITPFGETRDACSDGELAGVALEPPP